MSEATGNGAAFDAMVVTVDGPVETDEPAEEPADDQPQEEE